MAPSYPSTRGMRIWPLRCHVCSHRISSDESAFLKTHCFWRKKHCFISSGSPSREHNAMRNFPCLGASSYAAFPPVLSQPATNSSTLQKVFQTHWGFRLVSQMITTQPARQLKGSSYRDSVRGKKGKAVSSRPCVSHRTSCLFSTCPCRSKVVKAGNNLQVKRLEGS